jgi:hypothetical protein
MKQITVLLAITGQALKAKVRSEVLTDPNLVVVYDALTPPEAISQARMLQPQVVLCDRRMLDDGQMAAIAQQEAVVSLLVLIAMDDESWLPQLPVPVAGTVSAHHRPGTLAEKLQAIIDSPAAAVESTPDSLARVSEKPILEPIAYDLNELPSLATAGRLGWTGESQETSSYAQPSNDQGRFEKGPLLKSVSDYLGKTSR